MKEQFRLRSMPYAQCHVNIVHDEDGVEVELVSYSTSVCIIREHDSGITLYCSGTYSATTARHINRFTREFLGRSHYQDCKSALEVDSKSETYPGFCWVAKYGHNSPEHYTFDAATSLYDQHNFGGASTRKYYGSY